MTSNQELLERRNKVISAGYASGSTAYVKSAQGSIVTDMDGKEYIDFAGGIAVMNVGHSHPKVVAAVKDQAEKFTHTCFMVNPYDSAVELAEKLTAATPGDFDKKVVFINSGAEAVENAVKIARYYTKRPAIVVFDAAYHGRTTLTMSMTAKVKPYKWQFGPYAPEVYRAPFGDIDAFKEFFLTGIDPESVAAVIAEPIQGEGGFIAPPKDFFKQVKEVCEEHGILFVADEIQSGMGRTGKMFAIEHFGVEPDLMTVAKSMGAGMPISAVVGKAEIMDSVHAGGLGGTYGANPLACAAALAVFDIFETEDLLAKSMGAGMPISAVVGKAKIMDSVHAGGLGGTYGANPLACAAALAVFDIFETEDLLAKSVKLGDTLQERFSQWVAKYDFVGETRGIGAMAGFTIVDADGNPDADKAKALSGHCAENGLILLVCGIHGNVVRVLMPLTIEDEVLEKGLAIIEQGLAK